MKLISGFFGLIYDLVIGDCWQLAAETAAILLAAIGLLRLHLLRADFFSVGLGAVLMLVAALVIYLEGRISHARLTRRAAASRDADG